MDTKTRKTLKPWIRFYTQAFNILYQEGEKILDIIQKNPNQKPEAMSIILLLRKLIELSYGHYSLTKNFEFVLTKSLNREAFECALFLEFFQKENTRERILSYQIHGILERIKYNETFNPNHPIFETYQKGLENLKVEKLSPTDKDINDLDNEISRLKAILKTPPLKDVFEKYFEKNKKKKWYSIGLKGINSLRDLFNYLHKEVIYLTIYRDYSEYIHGYNLVKSDIIKSSNKDGLIELYGIPSPPFNLAHDFLFFKAMFVQSVKYSLLTMDINPNYHLQNLILKVNKHFNSNKVQLGTEFVFPDKVQLFPKN